MRAREGEQKNHFSIYYYHTFGENDESSKSPLLLSSSAKSLLQNHLSKIVLSKIFLLKISFSSFHFNRRVTFSKRRVVFSQPTGHFFETTGRFLSFHRFLRMIYHKKKRCNTLMMLRKCDFFVKRVRSKQFIFSITDL